MRLLLLQLFRLRGALHHDLPADPDPLSPYRVSGHFRDSAVSAGGRGRGLHMRTGDEARVARTSVQERVKTGAARNYSPMGGSSPSRSDVLSPWLLSGCGRAADGVRRGPGSAAGRSGDGRKGAGMNQWPCCFIDGGASPASHVSRADDCNSTARVRRHHGRIRSARGRSPYPFGDGGGASVRSANEVPRSSAAARVGMGSA